MSTATATAREIVQRAATEQAAIFDAAEVAVLKLAGGLPIDAGEQAILESVGWNHRSGTLDTQVNRARRVLAGRRAAGMNGDFEAAQEDAARSAAVLAERQPEIHSALAKLTRELADLENAASQADAEVSSMQAARLRLRDAVPPHVAEVHNRERARLARELTPELERLRNRLKLIDTVASWTWSDGRGADANGRQIIMYCQTLPPDHVAHPVTVRGKQIEHVVSAAAFSQHQAELRSERPGIVAALALLEPEAAAALAECDKLLDFWLTDGAAIFDDPELSDDLAGAKL